MTTLWIIRHGETDWNVAGRLQGQLEVPLNEKGREQVLRLGARLAHEHATTPFSALFTSDLGRARETASAIKLGLPLLERKGLRERHFGVLSKLTPPEAEARHPESFARLRVRDPDFVPEGGESLTQMYERALAALREIARAWPDRHVLVVTHGGVIDSAWRAARRLPLHVKRDHELFNASINRVRVVNDQFELAGWADIEHLSPFGSG
ncbi:MAG: histidine phosphatase family protein [Archangium sp.]|nr:histidine phosphatase family protein [Archangium sp.]